MFLYPAEETSQWAPNDGRYQSAVELKGNQKLTVRNSSLSLTGNVNGDGDPINDIFLGRGTLVTRNAYISADEIIYAEMTGNDYRIIYTVQGRTHYTVTAAKGVDDTITYAAPANPTVGNNYTFTGWNYGSYEDVVKVNGTNVTIKVDGNDPTDHTYTFTANLSYTGSTDDDSDDSSSGSSGGSSVTRYNVSVEDTDNGSIRVSPTRASRGQTVTITVTPDEGYELDELVVLDSDGDEIDLTDKGDGKFTFQMPRGKVTIEATFVETEPEPELVDAFVDVDKNAWYYDAVVYALDTGLMSGISEDEFAPNATLTRAMVAQMLYSLADKPELGSNLGYPYADVMPGSWYVDAVYWARQNGYITGYNAEQFGPDDALTREQLAVILYSYAQDQGYDTDGGITLGNYLDADAVSQWAVAALEWAVDAGLITGRGEGVLAPAGTATRAEVAQIFMNFLENVAR